MALSSFSFDGLVMGVVEFFNQKGLPTISLSVHHNGCPTVAVSRALSNNILAESADGRGLGGEGRGDSQKGQKASESHRKQSTSIVMGKEWWICILAR